MNSLEQLKHVFLLVMKIAKKPYGDEGSFLS